MVQQRQKEGGCQGVQVAGRELCTLPRPSLCGVGQFKCPGDGDRISGSEPALLSGFVGHQITQEQAVVLRLVALRYGYRQQEFLVGIDVGAGLVPACATEQRVDGSLLGEAGEEFGTGMFERLHQGGVERTETEGFQDAVGNQLGGTAFTGDCGGQNSGLLQHRLLKGQPVEVTVQGLAFQLLEQTPFLSAEVGGAAPRETQASRLDAQVAARPGGSEGQQRMSCCGSPALQRAFPGVRFLFIAVAGFPGEFWALRLF